MSSVTGPAEMSFALIGAYFLAGRSLPANIRVTTKADGTPITPVTTSSGNSTDTSLPATTSEGSNARIEIQASPVISASSSVTPTISWEHERTLERLIGRDATNSVLRIFDPSKSLKPGTPFQTPALSSPKDRFDLHEFVERVYQGRLLHETGKDQRMWLWVPGSVVPRYLQERINRRQHETASKKRASSPPAQDATTKRASSPSAQVAATRPSQPAVTRKINPAIAAAVARNQGPKNVDPAHVSPLTGWGDFARDTDADWQHKHSAAYRQARLAAEAANPTPVPEDTTVYKEKFIERKETPKIVDAGPKKAAIPPHMRKALAAAAAAKEAEASMNIVDSLWIAAKLPNPCVN